MVRFFFFFFRNSKRAPSDVFFIILIFLRLGYIPRERKSRPRSSAKNEDLIATSQDEEVPRIVFRVPGRRFSVLSLLGVLASPYFPPDWTGGKGTASPLC